MSVSGRSCGLSKLYHKRITREATRVSAEAFGVSDAEIMGRRNKASIAFARQIAMYLSHVIGQMSLGQVAQEFGRERSTIGYSCGTIEDRRDSPIFNTQVELLEQQFQERLTVLLTQELRVGATLEQKAALMHASA